MDVRCPKCKHEFKAARTHMKGLIRRRRFKSFEDGPLCHTGGTIIYAKDENEVDCKGCLKQMKLKNWGINTKPDGSWMSGYHLEGTNEQGDKVIREETVIHSPKDG